ncbi:hypothetical protein RvY_13782 [Ramazzottius varieornatus]|uniref:Major facilitator superfamily associated domain-containing protein n=1 Tax=Ramazzottius varieornatus TaxID=947166 RepID=A0A1D1VP17_RAMVA|nr:hypothetical protein RvY_13782 [Ramazzottius varieornatus]
MDPRCSARLKSLFHPHLLPLKALFFFVLGASACMIPYIPIYIQYLGLSASQNGLIFGGLPFVAMLSKPITGGLADRGTFRPATLSRIFVAIQIVFMFAIYFVPRLEAEKELPPLMTSTSCQTMLRQTVDHLPRYGKPPAGNFSCNVTWTGINATVDHVHFHDFAQLRNFVNGRNISCYCEYRPNDPDEANQSGIHWTLQFWLTGLLLVFGWFGYGAAFTINDTMAFALVETSPVPTTYGTNRVFGTIGWALCALLVGILLNTFSEDTSVNDNSFTSMFLTFLIIGCCGIASTFFLPPIRNVDTRHEDVSVAGHRIISFDVLLFCGGTFIMGICTGLLYGYFGWYLTELGASNLLVGLAIFSQCVFEVPMMALSGWIIREVGYHNCMVLSLVSFGVRFLGYYFLGNPWYVMLIETTHSIGFGLFYASMTSFAFERAPPGGAAMLQGLFGATYEGFGQGIGGVAAGFIYQYYGGRTTWLAYGVFAFATAGCYATTKLIGLRMHRSRTNTLVSQK